MGNYMHLQLYLEYSSKQILNGSLLVPRNSFLDKSAKSECKNLSHCSLEHVSVKYELHLVHLYQGIKSSTAMFLIQLFSRWAIQDLVSDQGKGSNEGENDETGTHSINGYPICPSEVVEQGFITDIINGLKIRAHNKF